MAIYGSLGLSLKSYQSQPQLSSIQCTVYNIQCMATQWRPTCVLVQCCSRETSPHRPSSRQAGSSQARRVGLPTKENILNLFVSGGCHDYHFPQLPSVVYALVSYVCAHRGAGPVVTVATRMMMLSV